MFWRKKTAPPATELDELELEQLIARMHQEAGQGFVSFASPSARLMAGAHRARRKGDGVQFSRIREVNETDYGGRLVTRAVARTGGQRLFRRETKPEVQSILYLLVDVGRTHLFGSGDESKLWVAGRSALTICLSLNDTHDRVVAIVYCSGGILWNSCLPTAPMQITHQLAQAILTCAPPQTNADGLAQALALVEQAMPPKDRLGQEIVIVSDYLTLSDIDEKAIQKAAATHSVRALIVQDARERKLQASWWPFPAPMTVYDLASGRLHTWWLRRKDRAEYERQFAERTKRLSKQVLDKILHEIVSTNEGEEATRTVLRLLALPPLFCA